MSGACRVILVGNTEGQWEMCERGIAPHLVHRRVGVSGCGMEDAVDALPTSYNRLLRTWLADNSPRFVHIPSDYTRDPSWRM